MNVFTPDAALRRFAYLVAGPRDIAINLVLNGAIAWWIFGGSEVVPLAGPDSIFKMLLPMAAIESTLTSFFGLLNGTRELNKKPRYQTMPRRRRWIILMVTYSLTQGILGLSVFAAAMFLARWLVPTVTLSPRWVPPIIGLISGTLAYVLHSRAVIKSETTVYAFSSFDAGANGSG